MKTVIIGSGMAGLTAGAYLARAGHSVTVFEQFSTSGGVPPVMGNKPPGHKTPIQGLWFIGAQSESGGGVVNVMTGAQKAAKQILKGQ